VFKANYSNSYISNELFHFVGRHEPTPDKQFELLLKILNQSYLRSTRQRDEEMTLNVHEKIISGELTRVAAICFCDIPRQSLKIHMNKYSQFGISFSKRYLSSKGAKPVIYIPIKSDIQGRGNRGEVIPERTRILLNALVEMRKSKNEINQALSSNPRLQNSVNAASNQWSFLASEFYYFIKMFDEDLEEDNDKNYYMEREWRLVNSPKRTILNFTLDDINALIVPYNYYYRLLSEFGSLQNRIEYV
jgi:hypothetical protein